ncbi:voltage-dependent calcium channel gamma-1 subunit isoform X3 [Notamacropus eugenii]|uniref:voltage-dependent calcium channel gamma-1 subunit isoform X3 n=1 Tax=Notamacropus eugenii TaxID=9315 RepID=UPI003B6839EC
MMSRITAGVYYFPGQNLQISDQASTWLFPNHLHSSPPSAAARTWTLYLRPWTPIEKNCSYFRHFNPGESSEIFHVTTQKEYSISAAAISIFSIGFMILGTIFILLSFRKKKDYLLRPASLFYTFAGLCIIVSVEVMRQSVKRMIDSEETVWIEYYYSWSFACACASFVLLFICGITLLLISLPRMPQNPWESCMDAEPEH